MDKRYSKYSEETHKYLEKLDSSRIDTSKLHQMIEDQKAGKELPKWEPEYKWYEAKHWDLSYTAVKFVKLLKNVIDLAYYAFMLIGGVVTVFSVVQVWKVCKELGWLGIFDTKYSLYILGYAAIAFLVRKISFFLFEIIYHNE